MSNQTQKPKKAKVDPRDPEAVLADKRRRQKLRRQARQRDLAIAEIYDKPIEDWDPEELAAGRPRARDGTFSGRPPRWVSREMHEEAIRRFQDHAQKELRGLVPKALETIQHMILDDSVDDKGRPMVPAAVRLQASQWVVEHLVGKPKVRLEADISVKLQGILAEVLVSPDEVGRLRPAMELDAWEEDEEADLLGEPGGE